MPVQYYDSNPAVAKIMDMEADDSLLNRLDTCGMWSCRSEFYSSLRNPKIIPVERMEQHFPISWVAI